MIRRFASTPSFRFSSFPLNIDLFREEAGVQTLKQSIKKRFRDPALIDSVVSLDKKYRQYLYNYQQNRKSINIKNKQLKSLYIEKRESQKGNILKQIDLLKEEGSYFTTSVGNLERELKELVMQVGNIVDQDVKVGDNQEDNKVYEKCGKGKKGELPYWEILEKRLEAVDMKRGTKITGHRGYFLKGVGVRLSQALISYGMDFLEREGYTLHQTPVTIKSDLMRACCQLSSIEEDVYKLEDDLMLIATSEQPLASMYSGEVLESSSLPMRLGGYSLCFRKQAGAAGRDNQGIFRVHQFQKLEQFVICDDSQSKQFLSKMLDTSKRFYQSLEIPYQIVEIVSGALNDAATRKFDLEGWFPHANKYRELVSVSNCTDYQSRMLDVKYRDKGTTKHVHMLNGTLCAIQRTLCAMVENYYTEDGIKLPAPLAKHYGSQLIPFAK